MALGSVPENFLLVHDLLYMGTHLDDNPEYAKFARVESEKECLPERYSQPFPVLLPRMACMPTYVVSRKGKLRLITDHSASKLSLNSLIDRDS